LYIAINTSLRHIINALKEMTSSPLNQRSRDHQKLISPQQTNGTAILCAAAQRR